MAKRPSITPQPASEPAPTAQAALAAATDVAVAAIPDATATDIAASTIPDLNATDVAAALFPDPAATDIAEPMELLKFAEPLAPTSSFEAADAAGIEHDQLFAWRVYPDRVVVVTIDGRKLEAPL